MQQIPKKLIKKTNNYKSILYRIQSRKFIVLILATIIFCIYPKDFTGAHLMTVMLIFISSNLAQKYMDGKK